MKKTREQAKLYMSNIRKLMVIQHDMSALEMQKQLEKLGIHLHVEYIRRLREKIFRERRVRADRMALNTALATFQDVLSETTHMAWQIALSPQSSKRERLAALKEIREAHKDLFDKLFDAGVFDRKLGTIDANVLRARPLSSEAETAILEAFQRWGMLPRKENDHAERPNKSLDSGAGVQQP